MQAHYPHSRRQLLSRSERRWLQPLKRRAPLLLASGLAFAGAAGFLSTLAYVADHRAIRLPDDALPQFGAAAGSAEGAFAPDLAASVPAALFEGDPGAEDATSAGAFAATLQSQDAVETASEPDVSAVTVPEAVAAGEGGPVEPLPETGERPPIPGPAATPPESPSAVAPAATRGEGTPASAPVGSSRTPDHGGKGPAASDEVVDPRGVVVEDLLEEILGPIGQVPVHPLPRLP